MIPELERIMKFIRSTIYIPDEVSNSTQFKILHLSDTPSPIYGALTAMARELKPQMIIHTGDIADEIKLASNPGCRKCYTGIAGPFIKELAQYAPDMFVIPGNHDFAPFIEGITPPGKVLQPGSVIKIKGHTLGAAHDITQLPAHAEFMLYGHNPETPKNPGDAIFLNGVTSINIILLPSGKVFSLPYPNGTDYHRRYKKHPKLI